MRQIITLLTLIGFSFSLAAQILPIRYFEEAYFTNYHHQKLNANLQKECSTPVEVLQYLMKTSTLEGFTKVLLDPVESIKELEKKQTPNIHLLKIGDNYGGNFSCELEYLIEFEYNDTSLAIIGYNLFLDDQLVNNGDRLGRLYLIKNQATWYLLEETSYDQNRGWQMLSRIGRAFSHLNADNWEYLITNQAPNIDAEMKEMRYYVVDDKGINISKFTDLTLYWSLADGPKRIGQFYSWPPCRKFLGWDESIPGVTKWFDRRNRLTVLRY